MNDAQGDLIHVVERAYSLEGTDREWLQNLADAARPVLDRGLGVLAFIYDAHPGRRLEVPISVGSGLPDGLLEIADSFHRATPPKIVEETYLARSGCGSASEVSGMGEVLESHAVWRSHLHPLGMHDYLATNALVDFGGRGCVIGAPLPKVAATPPMVRHVWGRLAAHITAGLRLRAALRGRGAFDGAEAVLSASGQVEHAEPVASGTNARRELTQAAVRMDHARSKLRRSDPPTALALWRGLVSGRWTLIDQFENGERKYVVARRNDPNVVDPGVLAPRERQIAWYASLGHSNKLIGYQLGLSSSSVGTHLARAATKLGVRSRTDLIAAVRGPLAGAHGNPVTTDGRVAAE